MALLRKREPILFFADRTFYTDDLHDNGVSEARLRVRVMPSCFFVLLRHWLRVDGSCCGLSKYCAASAAEVSPSEARGCCGGCPSWVPLVMSI